MNWIFKNFLFLKDLSQNFIHRIFFNPPLAQHFLRDLTKLRSLHHTINKLIKHLKVRGKKKCQGQTSGLTSESAGLFIYFNSS